MSGDLLDTDTAYRVELAEQATHFRELFNEAAGLIDEHEGLKPWTLPPKTSSCPSSKRQRPLRKVIGGLVTQDWDSYLVVECKNQKDKVGFPELAKLGAKMDSAKTNTGFVVATEGVTGSWEQFTDATGYVRERFRDGKRILCFVRDDLERLVAGENLLALLQEKLNWLHFPPAPRRPDKTVP